MDAYVERAARDMAAARDELLAALSEVGAEDWRRYVPYGSRTLHGLFAHLASADHAWALAAQGLLKGEAEDARALTPEAARAAREDAARRNAQRTPAELLDEMQRRRRLLMSLYELLEPRHLALRLPAYGERHNSVRERIWLGYHDRAHAADVRRALRLRWHPMRASFLPEVVPVVASLAPDRVLYVAWSVDPVLWERASGVPGWSNRQLLAHIAVGDWVLQTHLRHLIEEGAPAAWPDIDAGNAARIAERALTPCAALLEEYLSMRHETLRLLAQLTPEHVAQPIALAWLPEPEGHTVLEYLQGFHWHDTMHAEQLRPAMKYLR